MKLTFAWDSYGPQNALQTSQRGASPVFPAAMQLPHDGVCPRRAFHRRNGGRNRGSPDKDAGLSSTARPLSFAHSRGFATGVQDLGQRARIDAPTSGLRGNPDPAAAASPTAGAGPRELGGAKAATCRGPLPPPRSGIPRPVYPWPRPGPAAAGQESRGQWGEPPARRLRHGRCPLELKTTGPGGFWGAGARRKGRGLPRTSRLCLARRLWLEL